MSEPVSNAEIEDVLSSIRRLVSENTGAGREKAAQVETSERLVLTPAFRVLERGDATSEDIDETVEETEEISMSDDVPADFSPTPEPDAMSDNAEVNSSVLERKIAELEAAIGDTYEEWEPDGSEEEGAEAEPIVIKMATPAHQDDVLQTEAELDDEAEAETHEDAGAGVEFEAEFATDDPEETELAEPDLDEANDFADEELLLDEEALREMVADLVREELQGHVGQRITRSVRRLVRREISRVLALKDME